jgi:hypothetical protein
MWNPKMEDRNSRALPMKAGEMGVMAVGLSLWCGAGLLAR